MSDPILRRRPDVLWRRSLDSIILLAEDADEPVYLAGTGPEMWELLAEPRTLDALVTLLTAMYDADADVVRADVAPLLDRLVDAALVERLAP